MSRKRFGVTFAAVVAGLLVAGCGGRTASSTSQPGTAASAGTPALIHTQSMTIGSNTETVLKNAKGLTLYYFMADTSTTIACTSGCAKNWPPLISSSDHPSSNPSLPGTLTVMDGPNGKQVLYNGHPLYTYFKDGDSGDAYGQGIGGKWFAATPELAAAAASASASKTYGGY
jgi:predicted lipoprotein with Yx(FWY)xxD motif